MSHAFGKRRADWVRITETDPQVVADGEADRFAAYDLAYRTLCATLFNFAQSGHPGGSISTGRYVTSLLFETMAYDIGDPSRRDADILSYAAGHKALGTYAMLALRDEIMRIGAPEALPKQVNLRLRFEDLLGFRKNPTHSGPLFRKFGSKPLDGHPTPATPFVKLATGASGVGAGASLGLAVAAADTYGPNAPKVHLVEGEGGLTPGRVYEAMAFAGTAGLSNAIIHLDWNQASIDSNHVTREGDEPGDYVQWDPMEFFYLHDWNVVEVPDGFDLGLILTAQKRAMSFDNGQPTAVVYRTVKGWQYGIEGKKSHGGGHKLCSQGYVDAVKPFFGDALPACVAKLGSDGGTPDEVEACWWETLLAIRSRLEANPELCRWMAGRVLRAKSRLDEMGRKPRAGAPKVEGLYAACEPAIVPVSVALEPGAKIALRQQLGKVLGHLNEASGGAILISAADLLDSTAVSKAAAAFPAGFFHAQKNPGARALSIGGICEDGISCVLSGVAAFGEHVGAGASYGAFLAPLGHIAARLHAIGNQMRKEVEAGPHRPFMLILGHAGMKTGEDGPTHADPQALQLVQENFPAGTSITLTPWEPSEVWSTTAAAFASRPAVIFPFVTRPGEAVPDREALGLAPAADAAQGVYRLKAAKEPGAPAIVMQGSEVAYAFVTGALPKLQEEGIDVDVYYVSSAELFDRLPEDEQKRIFPPEAAERAMGITGFTLPTMYRWVQSTIGREHTLYPFQKGHYLGSGTGVKVVHEAGLDGPAQVEAIRAFCDAMAASAAG